MLLALGAASSALDALQSLTASKTSSPPTTGFSQNAADLFDVSGGAAPSASPPPATGGSGFTQISPATMSALLAAQGQSATSSTTSTSTSPSAALQDLFSKLDANGDGQISKSEFENALGAGGTNVAQADSVFNKLDTNGDGSVSMSELSSALKGAGGKGGHHHMHAASSDGSSDPTSADGSTAASGSTSASGSSSDPLLQALSGASSTSVSNSDGSTTTSVTYADGSKVSMTSPAATTSSSSATSSYNFIEQMIQRAAQSISSGAAGSLSFNV